MPDWTGKKVSLLLFILCIIPAPLPAQERTEDLAVLDISFTGEKLTKPEIEFLSDDIREKAVRLTRYRIMNKENIFAILRDKGIELGKCQEAECEVEYGRMLQADKLVTSSILFSGGIYYIKLKLYDVPTASIENSVSRECKLCDFSGLREVIRGASEELFSGVKPVERIARKIEEKPEKGRKAGGIYVYPSLNYYVSDIGGLNYGGGVGYRFKLPLLLTLGSQWTTGRLSKDGIEGTANFIELYTMVGINFIRDFGAYIKPSVNFHFIEGNGRDASGPGVRVEGGLHFFQRPIFISTGAFYDVTTTGIAFSFGGYF